MWHDYWYYIISKCVIKNILSLEQTCKSFRNKIETEYLWKKLMRRDFEDLHKVEGECWKQYYQRRFCNYGQFIMSTKHKYANLNSIGDDKYIVPKLKDNIIQCLFSSNQDRCRFFILTKDYELYGCGPNSDITKIDHHAKIKKIFFPRPGLRLMFIDEHNNLFGFKENQIYLYKDNVIDVIRPNYPGTFFCYTDLTGTYYLDDDLQSIKVFDHPIKSWAKIDDIDYYANSQNRLIKREFKNGQYVEKKLRFKIKQVSNVSGGTIFILDINDQVRALTGDKIHKFKISNVKSINGEAILTKNGNLYSFDDDGQMFLFDTNVVYIDYFNAHLKYGGYVKRCV